MRAEGPVHLISLCFIIVIVLSEFYELGSIPLNNKSSSSSSGGGGGGGGSSSSSSSSNILVVISHDSCSSSVAIGQKTWTKETTWKI
jgi:hypothetical protein